jgi:hypothetical protein
MTSRRTIRLEDLPPAVRRRITASAGVELGPLPHRQAERKRATRGLWRCHACGALFTAWAVAERHAHTERHVRIEVVLTTE